jgi:hypothetical protein
VQGPFKDLIGYNRQFRDLALRAYPVPRNVDVERIVIRIYARNLWKDELAGKLVKER